jgi:DNA-3-methyladenine glycosylase I
MVWQHDRVSGADGKPRCGWVSEDPLYQKYHDTEWGRPLRDDRALFELLTLEGCQAGLSWITVLRKREHYRKVYDGFDPKKIARYTPAKLAKLLADPGIIRHRGKIEASVTNARAYLALESDALSKALQKAGFKFVGSTICYAFMQASGMVDDHVAGCHCARERS